MKTKVLLFLGILLLCLSCSLENDYEDQKITPSPLEEVSFSENFLSSPNKEGRFISQEDAQLFKESFNQVLIEENSKASSQCSREIIKVYWNNEAEYDFDLRESIRVRFMREHGLDAALRSIPETVENDSELWIFRSDGTYPCHTQGVEAKINNQGNDHVNTDDD